MIIIHGPPVIRIDKTQIPKLRPLVNIGDTGSGELDQQLRQGIDRRLLNDPAGEGKKIFQKGGIMGDQGVDKVETTLFIGFVRFLPIGLGLGLAKGLDQELPESFPETIRDDKLPRDRTQ